MRTQIILIFLVIMSAVAVHAAPPFIESEPVQGGLIIEVPPNPYILKQSEFDFYFHVYNSTGHLQTNTTTDCYVHLYNTSNKHVVEGQARYSKNHLGDFVMDIPLNVSGVPGYYVYVVWCNQSGIGGVVSGNIEIVEQVKDTNSETKAPLVAIILLPMILALFLLIGMFSLDPEQHLALRIGLLLLSVTSYFISAWFAIQVLIKYYLFPELQDSLSTSVWVIGVMLFVLFSYFMIYAFVRLTHIAAKKKNEKMGYD